LVISMPYIRTKRGIEVFYSTSGSGRAILFLHGFAVDSSIWQSQVSLFSSDFCTVVFDLPGHGSSEWKYSNLEDLTSDVLSLYTALKIRQADIVAHSFSGLIGLNLAVNYPDLINKLILVAATPRFIREEDFLTELSMRDLEKLDGLIDSNYPEIIPVFLRSLFTEEERKSKRYSYIYRRLNHRQSVLPERESLKNFIEIIKNEDLRAALDRVRVPTLIVSGEQDPITGDYPARFLNRGIKGSHLEIFAACGHLPFLTKDDDFFYIAKRFLES